MLCMNYPLPMGRREIIAFILCNLQGFVLGCTRLATTVLRFPEYKECYLEEETCTELTGTNPTISRVLHPSNVQKMLRCLFKVQAQVHRTEVIFIP